MKRMFDISFALCLLALSAPVLIAVAIGIKLFSKGPIFYFARRIGQNGQAFDMIKFRTMHVASGGAVITAIKDPRIFKFGGILRRTKLDELPQFINILLGQMSVVGPRPEDPLIVKNAYHGWMHETLICRPGLTSPGALFYYARGSDMIKSQDPEGSYCETVLPLKLAIDRAYQDRATLLSDCWIIVKTGFAIGAMILGARILPARQDMVGAKRWLA